MSIAKRLIILMAVPLAILICLGAFLSFQFDRIEEQSRYISVVQVGGLTTLGRITRSFSEMRVNLRSIMLAKDQEERDSDRALLKEDQRELKVQFKKYEASFILDTQDREMFNAFQNMASEWEEGAAEIMLFVAADDMTGSAKLLSSGSMLALGPRASDALDAWNDYHHATSKKLSAAALQEMHEVKLQIGVAVGFAFLVSGALGVITYRRITVPLRTLTTTVQKIADGDYTVDVPYLSGTSTRE